jgi:hypothetical protein
MRFEERYFTAIGDGSTRAGADVLGAAGLAGREFAEVADRIERLRREPLGMAILRLFAGDHQAVSKILEIMSKRAIGKAYRLSESGQGAEINEVGAKIIAELVLDWFRDPICKPCGGHGYPKIKGTPTLSAEACASCIGLGRRPFDPLFPAERLPLARWMASELERDLQKASALAMQMLAPRLDLAPAPPSPGPAFLDLEPPEITEA